MKIGRQSMHARRGFPRLQPRRPRAARARSDAAKLSSPLAASSGARPPIPPAGARRILPPLRRPYLGATGLSVLVQLLAAALVLLLYVLVERTLEEPVPALVVTCVLGTWIVTAFAAGPKPRL